MVPVEASGGAQVMTLGHEVRLIPPIEVGSKASSRILQGEEKQGTERCGGQVLNCVQKRRGSEVAPAVSRHFIR